MCTLPLSLFSKLPQIRQNLRSQSTGQLSAFAVISQMVGCLARLFTTATEVGDLLISAGFALALLLNCILGAQLWMYWGKDEKEDFGLSNRRVASASNGNTVEKEKSSLPPPPWTQPRLATPPPRSPGSPALGGGRKWARKVD